MSIDARVVSVVRREDGSGELKLAGRPAAHKWEDGNPGQNTLRFKSSPPEVFALAGRNVWGGSDTILLGQTRIARRTGYTSVAFESGSAIRTAVIADTPEVTGVRKWWRTLLARLRLSSAAVCQMSVGKPPADYHDYPDSTTPEPWHFHEHVCRRCAKRFTV